MLINALFCHQQKPLTSRQVPIQLTLTTSCSFQTRNGRKRLNKESAITIATGSKDNAMNTMIPPSSTGNEIPFFCATDLTNADPIAPQHHLGLFVAIQFPQTKRFRFINLYCFHARALLQFKCIRCTWAIYSQGRCDAVLNVLFRTISGIYCKDNVKQRKQQDELVVCHEEFPEK